MAATKLIAMHINKGKTLAQCLKARTDYAMDPDKTENGELVTSYECDPMTAAEEFLLSKRQYEQNVRRPYKNDVIAYQIRQSFKPGEVTPKEANEIGRELAMRFTKGNHAFIVATHTDRAHIHNHIIFNSTNVENTKKFRDFHLSGIALARLSDIICLEHDLSVIERKPYSEHEKRTEYPKQRSFRDEIREAIDEALRRGPKDIGELIAFLQEAGYEYKPGKQPALRGKGQQRFIRFRSLGEGYSVEELTAVIAGAAPHRSHPQDRSKASAGSVQPHSRPDISFLIDIQEKMQQGKGAGYIQWAQVFNAKQKAKALMFMHEHGITSYEELAEKAAGSQERCDELLSSIRSDEARLKEIAAIREHLLDFSKAKKTFEAYKRSGYSQDFFEKNREVLSRRRAAKKAFDEYEKVHGSLPKICDLNAEYSTLITRKKKNYAEYHRLKPQMQEWQIAHRIVQDILKEPEAQTREEERQAETQKDKSNR